MKINSSSWVVENLWIKIKKSGLTYIVYGMYSAVECCSLEFTSALDIVQSEISSKRSNALLLVT